MSDENLSLPLCQCGCGQRVGVRKTGQINRFVTGHNGRLRIPDPFYVEEDRGYETPCWAWQGAIARNDYGKLERGGKTLLAHRWMYEREVGPIPEGLTLDHLCRQRDCVRPSHLEPVTMAENLRRGESFSGINARKTHCIHGHEFTPENTRWYRGHRSCRTCSQEKARLRWALHRK